MERCFIHSFTAWKNFRILGEDCSYVSVSAVLLGLGGNARKWALSLKNSPQLVDDLV